MITPADRMDNDDDGRRPSRGVVVTLLDMKDGTSRIIMDDVTTESPSRDTSWQYDCFYTHKRLSSTEIDEMALAPAEYQQIGEAVVARLLALNGRVR
jgi:hypothetical protein